MKKLIAITLLALHLFAIGGPVLLQQVASYRAEKIFNERIARGLYNVNDLTEIVIPVKMPNITDWPAYERVSGRIQFQNNSYNYVKMRLTRTAMYLQCIPNYQTTRFSDENIIKASGVKDIPIPKKDHAPTGKLLLFADFNQPLVTYRFINPIKHITHTLSIANSKVTGAFINTPGQPPEMA